MEHYGTELIEMLFKELTREEISRLDGYDAFDIAKGMQKEHIAADVKRGKASRNRNTKQDLK